MRRLRSSSSFLLARAFSAAPLRSMSSRRPRFCSGAAVSVPAEAGAAGAAGACGAGGLVPSQPARCARSHRRR
ncbi:hypothetical protein DSY14_26555 [Nocardiopsis sp. MG754419]|nr:hypothetical protein [Nocardiopsis sp. MG754419]